MQCVNMDTTRRVGTGFDVPAHQTGSVIAVPSNLAMYSDFPFLATVTIFSFPQCIISLNTSSLMSAHWDALLAISFWCRSTVVISKRWPAQTPRGLHPRTFAVFVQSVFNISSSAKPMPRISGPLMSCGAKAMPSARTNSLVVKLRRIQGWLAGYTSLVLRSSKELLISALSIGDMH